MLRQAIEVLFLFFLKNYYDKIYFLKNKLVFVSVR